MHVCHGSRAHRLTTVYPYIGVIIALVFELGLQGGPLGIIMVEEILPYWAEPCAVFWQLGYFILDDDVGDREETSNSNNDHLECFVIV